MNDPTERIVNLDIRCADLGQKLAAIPNMTDKTLNDVLTVLEEKGPYAMALYIQVREKKVANKFLEECAQFLREVFAERSGDLLEIIKSLAGELNDLLFASDLLRQALSYARYHLKAKGA